MAGQSGQAQAAVAHRGLITVCAMVATLMQALDGTIANVALPYMQGGLAATADQITWVLTSYITAAAILTAPVGFLVARFGRRAVFLGSVGGFTLASVLCGAAQTLEQMVVFRLLQGAFGAALVPLSQSTMLDIYPPEQRGQAMAIWGMGVMVGPILGPTLGGYLTENLNWRWVFYVNLPFGLLALFGLLFFLPKGGAKPGRRFDWTGFSVLALGVGALQIMLDRGELLNWFGSTEILIEATLAGLGLYLFTVHLTLAEKPSFRRASSATGISPRASASCSWWAAFSSPPRRSSRPICRRSAITRSSPPASPWRRGASAQWRPCSWPGAWPAGSTHAR